MAIKSIYSILFFKIYFSFFFKINFDLLDYYRFKKNRKNKENNPYFLTLAVLFTVCLR